MHADPNAATLIRHLKSVDDHNRERQAERRAFDEARRKTGVACPKCGSELEWPDGPFMVQASYPPPTTRPARCGTCSLDIQLEM